MWQSRTKHDLIIEVWEKLDCESVGGQEIEAIMTVVADEYGPGAVDSPMVIARQLADEGAELRHSEVMKLFVERPSSPLYDAALRTVIKLDTLESAAVTLRNLENLRRKYASDGDKGGLRLVCERALEAKRSAAETAARNSTDATAREENAEIGQWFTIWLQTPEVFEDWLVLRQRAPEFIDKFGDMRGPA